MADPTNPGGGAGAPPTPPGGGGPPIDPGMATVFERMATALGLANETASKSEQTLRAMAEHAGAVAEEAGKASAKLKDMFKLSDDIEANYKKIVDYAKKRGNLDQQELRDIKKAKKELEDLAGLYEKSLEHAKGMPKEAKLMQANLERIKKLMVDIDKEGKVTEATFQGIGDVFDRAAVSAKDMVRSLSNLSRTGATLKGMMGVLGAMGIGGGMSARVERKMAQIEEVKGKVREMRELRAAATAKHMGKKREGILAGMGPLKTDQDYETFAAKMGFKGKKAGAFIRGEKAMAAGEAAGPEYMGAMASGGGKIAEVMGGFETGVEGLMAGLEGVALPLMLVVGAIELLIKAFDGYVKQNQEIEAKMGSAGIFTRPGVGAGQAFMEARAGLTPPVLGQGVGLGINFDRNLAIAGAMANAGYGGLGADLKAPGMANARPGAAGEFMGGGIGEMQRVVMGVSRVGGLTDAQGIDNLIKLMGEYRESIASSEMFMAQLNKDTAAAGISTTKYLKIIDDVASHFDKMNKSLEQVTGVMREMSRYGSVSSETLKDMMEFLTTAQQKTDLGNLATATFTQTNLQGTKALDAERQAEKDTLRSYVSNLNQEAPADFGAPLDINGAIERGDFAGAQNMANMMRTRIGKVQSPTVRKNMMDALDKVQGQITKVAGVMDKSALGRAASEAGMGTDAVQQMTNLFQDIRTSAGSEAGVRSLLLEGGGSPEQKTLMQLLAKMLGVSGPMGVASTLRREAGVRLTEATAEGTPQETRRKLLKELFTEAVRKKGLPMSLKQSGLDKFLREDAGKSFDAIVDGSGNTEEGLKKVADLVDQNQDSVAAASETTERLVKKAGEGVNVQKDDLAHSIDQARAIALRTQTVEDFLKNIIGPLMNRLVFAVESIAKWISGLIGGDFQKSAADQAKDMAKVPDAIMKLTDMLEQKNEELKKDPNNKGLQDDVKKGTETLKKLQALQEQGVFYSQGQEDNFLQALEKINQGQITAMKDATDVAKDPTSSARTLVGSSALMAANPLLGTSYLGYKAAAGVYHYFHGETNQAFVPPSSPGSSPTEHPEASKPTMSGKP